MGIFDLSGKSPRQDFIMLGGKQSPGTCAIHGASVNRGWDIRKGWGTSGAFVVYTGANLATFGVTFTLWENPRTDAAAAALSAFSGNQWDEWADFATVLTPEAKEIPAAQLAANAAAAVSGKPINSPIPKALQISHPVLVTPPLNITSVVVEDIGQWNQDDDGLWTCTVKFIQFRKPIAAIGKPDSTAPPVTPPKPRDAGEQQMIDNAAHIADQKAALAR